MDRPAAPTDFTVEVDGIGTIVFARRTRRDGFRIAAEYHRLTEGVETLGSDFGLEAEAQATLSVLFVSGPAGFKEMISLDIPDPLDEQESAKIVRAFLLLRKKELSFRPRPHQEVEGSGEKDGGQYGTLVSGQVQPATD